MKYSLKKSFLIKESKEEQVELNGTELSVYHLTQKSKLSKALLPRGDANYEMPELTGDRAKDIISKAEYSKYPKMQEPSDSEIEYSGITSILGDPFTKGTGFEPGTGDMYGPGLYTCFKFNPSIASTYGNVCLKFKFDISNCIICFEDLARQVHGDKWEVIDQVENILNKISASQEINSSDAEVAEIVNDIKSFTDTQLLHSGNIRGKSFLKESDYTSEIAHSVSKLITKLGLSSFIDGLIFRGERDGPVCVIYNPKRDAKLINIGRLKEEEVNWSNSISEFFGNNAYSNITFEDMNAISEENYINEEIFDLKLIKEKIKIVKLVKDKNTPTEILTQIYRKSNDNKVKISIINHKNVDPELLYQIVNSLSYDDPDYINNLFNVIIHTSTKGGSVILNNEIKDKMLDYQSNNVNQYNPFIIDLILTKDMHRLLDLSDVVKILTSISKGLEQSPSYFFIDILRSLLQEFNFLDFKDHTEYSQIIKIIKDIFPKLDNSFKKQMLSKHNYIFEDTLLESNMIKKYVRLFLF